MCAAHQRCSRFSIKWPWPRWECDIAPSICSFRPNFDSHARECWGVVRAPSSRLKARRRSTDTLAAQLDGTQARARRPYCTSPTADEVHCQRYGPLFSGRRDRMEWRPTGKIGTANETGCCPQDMRANGGSARSPKMLSVEQCRACAAEYKALAANPGNSARRSAVLANISRSWTALAHQFESLALIVKSEGG